MNVHIILKEQKVYLFILAYLQCILINLLSCTVHLTVQSHSELQIAPQAKQEQQNRKDN